MEILEVSPEEYKRIVEPAYIFGSVEFSELNVYKVDFVKYLFIQDNKKRFALCAGLKDNVLNCPFSAPFGNLEIIKKFEIEKLDEAIEAIDYYAVNNGIEKVNIILPPLFYNETVLSAYINSLLRHNYCIKYQDINFQLDLRKCYNSEYANMLPRNGRKNLRIGLEAGLELIHCKNIVEKKDAYQVIAINRREKGYPLRMSFEQVSKTINVIQNDFFIVKCSGVNIAAAQIFYITSEIAQVIYWGDIPGYSEYKPINFLAYKLIQFYGNKGLKYLDIGPSTEFGIPNYGLCDFKLSLGCDMSPKFKFEKLY
nr:hypothetical protein [uncultured Clostridium sp.]